MVEIEIFSYCNRKCWFCPNSFIDRNSTNILMLEELYLKILNQLKSINYNSMISYSRYNEPTSNREIFIKRLKQAKAIIPNASDIPTGCRFHPRCIYAKEECKLKSPDLENVGSHVASACLFVSDR